MTAGYGFRPRRLTRSTGVFLGLLAGYTIGSGLEVMAHVKLLSRLENPEGFKTALQNIAKDMDDPQQRGLIIARTIHSLPKREEDSFESGMSKELELIQMFTFNLTRCPCSSIQCKPCPRSRNPDSPV